MAPKIWLALTLLFTGTRLHAAPAGAAGAGTKQAQTESPDFGLCMRTPVNMSRPQITQGLCQTIMENMNGEPCMKEKVEALYEKARAGTLEGLDEWCGDAKPFTSSLGNFKLLLMNMQAAVWQEESNWQSVMAKKANPSTKKKAGGITQLSVDSVQGYACGCKGKIKSQSDIMDPHKNLTCGTGIALTNMARDGKVGSGKNGDKTSYGLAKYHEPARDSSKVKEKVVSKVNYYCAKARGNPVAYSPFDDAVGGRTRFAEGAPSSIAF